MPNLTTVEEAKAFAEYVDVSVLKDEVETLEEAGLEVTQPDRQGGQYMANFADYIEFLNREDVGNCYNYQIYKPSRSSQSVIDAAENLPGTSQDVIENRTALLLLPNDLLQSIENGDLTSSNALPLVKFRHLGDVEQPST